jgi:hypothetical protein
MFSKIKKGFLEFGHMYYIGIPQQEVGMELSDRYNTWHFYMNEQTADAQQHKLK